MSTSEATVGSGPSYAELEQAHALNLYPKRGITIVKGAGATLEDESGRTYIDCTAGVGVANLGHAHPRLVEAISAQAARLITCPTIFDNDTRARLLAKLAEVTPAGLDRAFLCNSGAEANEAAIKFARHATGKNGFVSAMRGFHGRTMGALSATHKYRDAFEPLLPGFGFAPYNNLDKLAAAVTEDTAAVVIELDASRMSMICGSIFNSRVNVIAGPRNTSASKSNTATRNPVSKVLMRFGQASDSPRYNRMQR